MSDSEIAPNKNVVNPKLAIKKHPILKILFVMLAISSLALIFSLLKVNQINSSKEVYGLADAATLTCSQIETLANVFGDDAGGNCVDGPAELAKAARYEDYDRESLYQGLSVSSVIILITSLLLLLYFRNKPAPSRKVVVNQESDTEKQYLLKLQDLKRSGLLNDQEYEEKRKKFLENL